MRLKMLVSPAFRARDAFYRRREFLMIGLQVSEKGKLTKINKMEICDNAESSKVKITKVMLTPEDFQTIAGDEDVTLPVIPGRIAIGQITDASDSAYLTKGTRVYLGSVENCGSCAECLEGEPEKCENQKIAGKTADGFLRDFAVVDNNILFALPATVKDDDALFIDYVALSLAIIDKLDIKKGEHVAVIGGGLIGTILSSLIIYYQSVPILIDSKQENLERAKLSGIYYNLFSDNKLEKEVSLLTGARMAQKVVYVTDSNINTDVALKIAAHNARIGFAGFSNPNLRVNFHFAMQKQLNFECITSGYGFTEQAINLIANKAVDFSNFKFSSIKYEGCEQDVKKIIDENKDSLSTVSPLIVDMM